MRSFVKSAGSEHDIDHTRSVGMCALILPFCTRITSHLKIFVGELRRVHELGSCADHQIVDLEPSGERYGRTYMQRNRMLYPVFGIPRTRFSHFVNADEIEHHTNKIHA